ncbi:MAG: alpha/beta hydrolase [Pseudomarimonas sp.]
MELQTGNALVYRASAAPPAPRRLLILSHGVGGNEMNLAPLAARAPVDTVVILVRAPLTLGQGQFAWFPVSFGAHGPRPDLEAAEDSRQRLALFVAEMQAAYGVAPNATVVAGFSQGGIISASVALTQPEIVAGFGVLAGRILPEIEPRLADGEALSRVQGFIGHGRGDTKLPVEWAHRADAWLTDLGVPHETRLYPGDHGIPQLMQDDLLDWFQRVTE